MAVVDNVGGSVLMRAAALARLNPLQRRMH
jgi:hypothetical protein